jgi:hypothetical protein
MARHSDPNAPRCWVAIDVAKKMNVVIIERSDGLTERFRFTDCREDYDRLVGHLRIDPSQTAVEAFGTSLIMLGPSAGNLRCFRSEQGRR